MRQQMKPDTGNCGENGQLPARTENLHGQAKHVSEIKKRKPFRLPPDDFGGMDETRTRDLLRDRQAF